MTQLHVSAGESRDFSNISVGNPLIITMIVSPTLLQPWEPKNSEFGASHRLGEWKKVFTCNAAVLCVCFKLYLSFTLSLWSYLFSVFRTISKGCGLLRTFDSFSATNLLLYKYFIFISMELRGNQAKIDSNHYLQLQDTCFFKIALKIIS